MTRGGSDAASDIYGMTLARELVDDGETFDLLPIGAGIVNEFVSPHLVGAFHWQRAWS